MKHKHSSPLWKKKKSKTEDFRGEKKKVQFWYQVLMLTLKI